MNRDAMANAAAVDWFVALAERRMEHADRIGTPSTPAKPQ
jgi:hypothetical protein